MDHSFQRRPPEVHFEFQHQSGAARQAREALRPLWAGLGVDPIEESVTLAASELVTNVVRHTDGGGLMEVWDPKPGVPLRLEVGDRNHSEPVPPDIASETGGRGLRIVAGVADDWGFEPTVTGKVVWAEFSRLRAAPDSA